jgi:hypothetical protein
MSESKICKKCGVLKDVSQFYKHRNSCKKCHNEYGKIYIKNNKEKKRERDRRYYQKNKERLQELGRKRKDTKMKESPSNLTYFQLHHWIRDRKPKPKYCTICNEEKELELANISGVYLKDISDYIYVCRSCHVVYDREKYGAEKEG